MVLEIGIDITMFVGIILILSLSPTFASQRLKGSALGDGMDWMMRKSPLVFVTALFPEIQCDAIGLKYCRSQTGSI